MNPFELNAYLKGRVKDDDESKEWLNAGRGNPNWTASVSRKAYYLSGDFATDETLNQEGAIIGSKIKDKKGRVSRFEALLKKEQNRGAAFLKDMWGNGEHLLRIDILKIGD